MNADYIRVAVLCALLALSSTAASAQDDFGMPGPPPDGFDNTFNQPNDFNVQNDGFDISNSFLNTPSEAASNFEGSAFGDDISSVMLNMMSSYPTLSNDDLPSSWQVEPGNILRDLPLPAEDRQMLDTYLSTVVALPPNTAIAGYLDAMKAYQKLLDVNAWCGQTAMCGASPAGPEIFAPSGTDGGGVAPIRRVTLLEGGVPPPPSGKNNQSLPPLADMSFSPVVALLSSGHVQCTGIILGPQTVATAAHCICAGNIDQVFVGSSIYTKSPTFIGNTLSLKLASTDSYRLSSAPACVAGAEGAAARGPIDLGVLYLESALQWPADDFPVIASAADLATPPASGWAVGFGASELTDAGGTKRFAQLPLQFCDEKAHNDYGCDVGRDWVSVATDRPADTCYGDSGGPLFLLTDGQLKLIGITARRRSGGASEYCGSGGIYTAVAGPLDTAGVIQAWIRENVR